MSATSWLADLAPWALKGLHCSTGRSERRLGSTGTCSNTCRGIPFLYPARTFMRKDLPLRAGPQMVTSPSGIVPSRASSVHVSSSATPTIDDRFSSSFSHLRTCPGEVWQPPTPLQLRYNSVTTPLQLRGACARSLGALSASLALCLHCPKAHACAVCWMVFYFHQGATRLQRARRV